MTISYNWLCEYLPVKIEPAKLSVILTSLGLEVENFERKEEIPGSLEGLIIGEVLEVTSHPNADKLRITRVSTGGEDKLRIVCGAPNVAVGQKVVVAPVGATIYPVKGDPLTMKVAKIRGIESFGMICAEDEIGRGDNHNGIMVLDSNAIPGTSAAAYFKPDTDWIYEIGLTPNRMDAMSHLGVAKDVCAYLTVHENQHYFVKYPYDNSFKKDAQGDPFDIIIKNTDACQRYCGLYIENVTISESPEWLQKRIRSIGLRPINNIVDITNFILHETGQPLHAFDADQIKGRKLIIENLPEGTPFVTLDEKERRVNAEDLMICNAENEPMCFGGVFGGLHSGVTSNTRNIFLESAWFNPITIRKTSFRHNLRTDAAARFEKGVDISNTAVVLQRAGNLVKSLAGGTIASDIMDVYPDPKPKAQVTLKYEYLKKLSGKYYAPSTVKNILTVTGFDIISEDNTAIVAAVPFSKPDIALPADIVEEIMRIDGYDNVAIPQQIAISPSVETLAFPAALKEKLSNFLAGNGFNEIFTNSITNSAYFDEEVISSSVKMLNSLSAELNIMRPSMLETGLECIVHNLNRKNNNLRLFEFGKTYRTSGVGKYEEKEKLCLYISGTLEEKSWKAKEKKSDFYYLKGIMAGILQASGLEVSIQALEQNKELEYGLTASVNKEALAHFGLVHSAITKKFDIRQPVWYGIIDWKTLSRLASKQKTGYVEIPRFPAVERDLAIVIDKKISYREVEEAVAKAGIKKLRSMYLFDVFESDKLGASKKSFAVSFTFLDTEKTLTDKEIDGMMQKIMGSVEKELSAEIRK
ncbi:MAG: phenylalanine--tRNA ligase subunit beta [Sphingobacteriales bacterium]|nr:phenylalanine--tRNA ligase subunit beta [Sphingobacteriales bacterium]OJY84439.1 MAG: phenylalanine--tRNA ligase subunit beta [Sphingobacteriales bacterium 44-15]